MSSTIIRPLLVGDVRGNPVRYFTSPLYLAHKQADMPWHSVDDLWPTVMSAKVQFDQFKQQVRGNWGEPRTVATEDGIVTVAPHFMAEGLFEAALDERFSNIFGTIDELKKIRGRYRNQLTAAMKLMTPHLRGFGQLAFALSAMEGQSSAK